MDTKTLVQKSVQNFQASATSIRQAASQTTNVQARNVLTRTASQVEEGVKQIQAIINQL
ncbi:MAG: hypothetical protein GXY50_07825 [Syntrophomonadaceae bacterium]|nr:hypothetical protein [Syntrophomonadaceae bacterium]